MKDQNHNFKDIDELLNEDSKRSSQTYNPMKLIIVFVLSILAIATGYYFYNSYKYKGYNEIIIIEAEPEETKVRPSDPGGMVVNNMDKEVYNSIDKNDQKESSEPETLLPPAEEPVDKKAISNQIEDIKNVTSKENPREKELNNAPDSKENVVSAKNQTLEKEEYIKPVAQAKSKQKNKKKTEFAKKSDKSYRVQIASFKSGDDARKEWNNLSNRYPKLLGKYKHYIVSKYIEGKGIYQRLQVGPFDSEESARKACSEFKNARINCFIIRP